MPAIEDTAAVLRGVLDEWKAGIDADDPQRVAAVFDTDAVFQGLRPYSVGSDGVAGYYDSQPAGMTVEYAFQETRRIGADAVLGYIAAVFSYRERPSVRLNIGVLAVRTGGGWRIGYYQASPAI